MPFSAATAEQLIAIARHPILANPDHAQNLPPSWTTLYRLSRLSEREVEAGIASGAIHAGMQRKDAMALRGLASAAPAGTAPSGKNASQSTTHRTSADYLEAFEELISRAVKNLPTAQHAQLFVGLRLIVFHWEGAAEENAAPSASEQPAKMLH